MAWIGAAFSKTSDTCLSLFLLVCVQRPEKFLDPSASSWEEEPFNMQQPPPGPIGGLYSRHWPITGLPPSSPDPRDLHHSPVLNRDPSLCHSSNLSGCHSPASSAAWGDPVQSSSRRTEAQKEQSFPWFPLWLQWLQPVNVVTWMSGWTGCRGQGGGQEEEAEESGGRGQVAAGVGGGDWDAAHPRGLLRGPGGRRPGLPGRQHQARHVRRHRRRHHGLHHRQDVLRLGVSPGHYIRGLSEQAAGIFKRAENLCRVFLSES